MDGGLFRISRLDEAPAHEGPDEIVEEPAYEREFPLPAMTSPRRDDDEDETRGRGGSESRRGPVAGAAGLDSLTAATLPPPPPPAPVMPPMPEPPEVPSDDPDHDHDGLTVTGAWQPPPAEPPGIPGQPPAPDVTVPVARLEISNGDEVDVDRAIVIGRAPEARRFNDTEQPQPGHGAEPAPGDLLDPHRGPARAPAPTTAPRS